MKPAEPVTSQRAEERRTDDGGRMTGQSSGHHFSGSAIILPSLRPISWHWASIELCSAFRAEKALGDFENALL